MGNTRRKSNRQEEPEDEIERKARELHEKWEASDRTPMGESRKRNLDEPPKEWERIDDPAVERKFQKIHEEWLREHSEEYKGEGGDWWLPSGDNFEAGRVEGSPPGRLKITVEDIKKFAIQIKPYIPLLSAIRVAAEKYGEAEVLKVVVGTEAKKYVRDLFDTLLINEMNYEAKEAGILAQEAENVALLVTPLFPFKEVPDLGEFVPAPLLLWLLKRPNPLKGFYSFLFLAEHYRLLCAELDRRCQRHPELEELCKYSIAKGINEEKRWGDLHVFAPDEFRRGKAYEEIWKIIKPTLSPKLWNYMHYDEDAKSEGMKRLFEEVDEWATQKRYPELIVGGLQGELKTSLRDEAQRGIDARRKREQRQTSSPYTKEELRDYLATKEESEPKEPRHSLVHENKTGGDEEGKTPYRIGLDNEAMERYVPPEDEMGGKTIDLSRLGLDLDSLTSKELSLLQDVSEALDDGYDFSSKREKSFRKYWGEDYTRKIKAWERLKAKLESLRCKE